MSKEEQEKLNKQITLMIDKIKSWAKQYPSLFEYPEEAVTMALREFVIRNKLMNEI